ncbi:MAG TPA: 2-phospho-L-lactate guanylyltransferase [Methylomirabilota bacterium]
MSILVAVPVKDLANAKQRLVAFLSPSERGDLARAMLEDVLEALDRAKLGPVLVVTREPEVEQLAASHGAGTLREEINLGHTEAVAHAQRAALARGAKRFLTIPGDVPCVTPGELRALAETPMETPGAVFVPSLSGFGTNAALLEPPDVMPLKFGEPSFDNHLVAARAAGLRPRVRRLPGIGLDVDAPDDLGLLLERGPSTRSARLLVSLDVPARLARPRLADQRPEA